MPLLLATTEPQPEFPLHDLTRHNADALSLMMANEAILTSLHGPGESSSWAYRVGHPAAVRSSQRIYDGAPVGAVSHGAMVFEALHAAVSASSRLDGIAVNKAAIWLTSQATDSELSTAMVDAVDTFRAQMPNTAEVIAESSYRFIGPLTHYAILGAALERDIVITALDFTQ